MIGRGISPALAGRRPERWSEHHDNRLRDTGGRYGAIAALAEEWGVESRALLARWLRLRGEVERAARKAGRGRPAPAPLDFEALLGQVRPCERKILQTLRGAPGCGYADLARRCDLSKASVQQYLSRIAPVLSRAGWALVKAEDMTPRQGGGRPLRLYLEPAA